LAARSQGLAQLNSDGSIDGNFCSHWADIGTAVQPDGRFIGGDFQMIGGATLTELHD
jgi:hypothetical protein